MTISEAIAELQLLQQRHGDLVLAVDCEGGGGDFVYAVFDIDAGYTRLPDCTETLIARVLC